MSGPDQAPKAPPRSGCFDQQNMQAFKDLGRELLEQCPELRGATVIFDYYDDLNQVAKTALWMTRSGAYDDVAEVFSALEQTSRVIAKQAETAVVLIGRMALRAAELRQEIAELEHKKGAKEG